MQNRYRTDLALEEHSLRRGDGEIPGVKVSEETLSGFHVTKTEIENEEAASVLCKPIGTYYTVDFTSLLRRREADFEQGCLAIRELIRRLMGGKKNCTLVVGLGNPLMTPDAVGPLAVRSVLATRHLKAELPEQFGAFSSVAVTAPGVLGTTGIESAEAVRALAQAVKPELIIAIDALAAADMSRLCRTVQISDAGIAPGSGVGNDRAELCEGTLGVPVIAVGVPTVTDASDGLFVTPRDIDAAVRDTAKLIGYGVNLALHEGLSVGDVDLLVS